MRDVAAAAMTVALVARRRDLCDRDHEPVRRSAVSDRGAGEASEQAGHSAGPLPTRSSVPGAGARQLRLRTGPASRALP
jgi:hypothetical protein